jgi:four helix bundle protein
MSEEEEKFDFEDLKVYQKSLEYINWVYTITSSFPNAEIYGLVSQFRRAAQSIALNIAEGYGEGKAQMVRYLRISRGSIRECIVCSSIAFNLSYISSDSNKISRTKLIELSKMIKGLINFAQK